MANISIHYFDIIIIYIKLNYITWEITKASLRHRITLVSKCHLMILTELKSRHHRD
jgi:hypothetical protein